MLDISGKIPTLRTARAQAVIRVSSRTLKLVKAGGLPKGDPFPVARVAAILAAKNTSQIIPYCHPLLLEHVDCAFLIGKGRITIQTSVKAVYKTGVEMEALTAASAAALTIYDMLKIVDPSLEIEGLKLLGKTGGKSDLRINERMSFKAAVLILSDSIAARKSKDESGRILKKGLSEAGFRIERVQAIPDDRKRIEEKLKELADRKRIDVIITSGGTGLGPRDVTPEATAAVIDREADGISEFLRTAGSGGTPYALLSRGRAGLRGRTLIVNIAGSPGAARDAVRKLVPLLPHALVTMRGKSHRSKRR